MDNILNNFLLEYKKESIEFDKSWFEKTTKLVQEGIISDMQRNLADMSIIGRKNLYHKYINKAIEDLDSLNVDIDELNNFLSHVFDSKKLDQTNLTIPLRHDDDIQKIRPEYLQLFSNQFDKGFRDILSGKINSYDFDQLMNGEFFNKLKRQLVKTSIKFTDIRSLMELESPDMVAANSEFVQEAAIFFIRQYSQNVKEIKTIAIRSRNMMDTAIDDMIKTSNAIKSVENGSIDIKTKLKLEKFMFNMQKNFLDTCAYLTAIIIRKISYYAFNITSYMNLYNTINDFYPEGKLVLHENVLNGKLDDLDSTQIIYSFLHNGLNIIIPAISGAIDKKKFEIAAILSRKYNRKIEFDTVLNTNGVTYDIRPYAVANKSLKDIYNNIQSFVLNSQNTDMTVDDVIASSSLDETFASKYSGILASIADISYYTNKYIKNFENSAGDTLLSLYKDIDNFEKNVETISTTASECYDYIKKCGKDFEVNKYELDKVSFEELKSFQETLMINYKDYLLLLVRRLIDRLDNLIDALHDNDNLDINIKIEDFVPYNYSMDAYREAYEDLIQTEDEIFNELYQEYYRKKYEGDHSVVAMYEADGDGKPATGERAPSTTVTVHSSDANSDQNPPGGTTGTTEELTNDSKAKDGAKQSIIQRFINWIRNIIQQFLDKTKKITTKNNKWIAKHKQQLLALDYTGKEIVAAPYPDLDDTRINQEITNAETVITGVNKTAVPNQLRKNGTAAETYIFQNIPAAVGGKEGFSNRIKQLYIYGNNDTENTVAYTDDKAKEFITNAINYCENYQRISNTLKTNLLKLGEKAAAKQEEINQENRTAKSDGTQVKTESNTVITAVVRDYTAAILTVFEQKYYDYMKALAGVLPETNTEEEAPQTQNEKEQK